MDRTVGRFPTAPSSHHVLPAPWRCPYMAERRAIEPDGLSTPDRPWSHGVLPTGRPLYVSGQTAVGPDGSVVHPDDLEKQFERALENLERVLDDAGGTMGALTALTIYLTDVAEWRERDVGETRYDYLEEPYPCSTLIEVSGLARPEFLVEVEAVAHVGG